MELLAATRFLPDGRMLIAEADNLRIGIKYTPTKVIPQPSPEIIAAALGAREAKNQLEDWRAAGRPIVTVEDHARRLAACNRCPDRHCASVCSHTALDRWVGSIRRRGPGCLW